MRVSKERCASHPKKVPPRGLERARLGMRLVEEGVGLIGAISDVVSEGAKGGVRWKATKYSSD